MNHALYNKISVDIKYTKKEINKYALANSWTWYTAI